MDVNKAYLTFAPQLWDRGYSPLPLSAGRPLIRNWTAMFASERPTREDVAKLWSRGQRGVAVFDGLGVATFGGIGFFLASDWEMAVWHLPKLADAVAVTRPGKGVGFVARAPSQLKLTPLVRTRLAAHWMTGRGSTLNLPPTVDRASGEPIAWETADRTLLDVNAADLPLIVQADVYAAERSLQSTYDGQWSHDAA